MVPSGLVCYLVAPQGVYQHLDSQWFVITRFYLKRSLEQVPPLQLSILDVPKVYWKQSNGSMTEGKPAIN